MNIPSKYKIWRYPLLLKIRYFFKSMISRDKVCITYWINANTFIWSPRVKYYNWGDYINLKFAELISGKTIIPSHYHTFAPKVAMIGSILPWAMDKDTIIWGSGCLDSCDAGWKNIEKPHEVRAVRGPLTREVLLKNGIECPSIYGDPVLLFPRYYNPSIPRTDKIGIIPHVSSISRLQELLPQSILENDNVVVISPETFTTWHEFIDKILSCKLVLSASLHGLIVADAYEIPNIWVSFQEEKHRDNYFKFHDYFLSVGKENIEHPLSIEDVNFDDIQKYIKAWRKPEIDLNQLYEACPIK